MTLPYICLHKQTQCMWSIDYWSMYSMYISSIDVLWIVSVINDHWCHFVFKPCNGEAVPYWISKVSWYNCEALPYWVGKFPLRYNCEAVSCWVGWLPLWNSCEAVSCWNGCLPYRNFLMSMEWTLCNLFSDIQYLNLILFWQFVSSHQVFEHSSDASLCTANKDVLVALFEIDFYTWSLNLK